MSMWENTTALSGEINYGDKVVTTNSFTPNSTLYIGFNIAARIVPNSELYDQWIRTRAYPPNGVMPSVSFGSVA